MLWDETIGAGGYATRAVPAGTRVRLVDVAGDACAGLLLHRADHPAERLNVADTVKLQWQAYLGPGYLLLSDMGRVLASVVDDTSAATTRSVARPTGSTTSGATATVRPTARRPAAGTGSWWRSPSTG